MTCDDEPQTLCNECGKPTGDAEICPHCGAVWNKWIREYVKPDLEDTSEGDSLPVKKRPAPPSPQLKIILRK